MDIKRRKIIQAVGVGSALGAISAQSIALSASESGRYSKVCLQTGLSTDQAFAEAIKPDHKIAFEGNIDDFQTLVDSLSALKKSHVFALVEPANAVLIEQAAREANVRIQTETQVGYRRSLIEKVSPEQWATELGRNLANNKMIKTDGVYQLAQNSQPFVALKLSV